MSSPVYNIIAVPVENIEANDYNPNSVATPEMNLLYQSILIDGYTMPIVCYFDKDRDKYIIVDGFHRYTIMKKHKDIFDRENGMMPVSIIEKDISDRMASTIRHNRARGSQDIDLMSNIIANMHNLGKSDKWISEKLGMQIDEIIRLKQVSGLAELFKDKEFTENHENF